VRDRQPPRGRPARGRCSDAPGCARTWAG
jgi:hypothetical protein